MLAQIDQFANDTNGNYKCLYSYVSIWKNIFEMMKGVDMNKPITPELLADPSNGFVKMIVYIYSMESFIFKELNAASRNKDESKLKFYGPLASALSFIVHCGN